MSEQSETDSPESLTAAQNPFAKSDDAAPPDDGPGESSFEPGDSVQIRDSDMVGQVAGTSDDGAVVIELVLPPDALEPADEAMAASAAERFTERQRDRVRDRDMADLKAMVASLTEQITPMAETVGELKSKRDADERTEQARAIMASAGLE